MFLFVLYDMRYTARIMAQLGTLFFRYLVKEFLIKFAGFFSVLLGIVFIFNTVELIRRSEGHDDVTLSIIMQLSIYKLPDIGQQILPFIVLFAAIATLKNLSDRQELVCIRAAGISAWQFLTPLMTTAFSVGLIYITLIHPLSAAALSRYEQLDNLYFGTGQQTISINEDGLWIRQSDDTGSFIIRADDLDAKHWVMKDVTGFFFDENGNHLQRIDADTVSLDGDVLHFSTVNVFQNDGTSKILPDLKLKTTLTLSAIQDSFSAPETMSFWRLPHFISIMNQTGLDTTAMYSYYQTLLSMPLLLIAMILVSGAVSLQTMRGSSLTPVVTGGLGLGFLIFFMAGFFRALGVGHELPVVLAVWVTPLLVILGATNWIIYHEDG